MQTIPRIQAVLALSLTVAIFSGCRVLDSVDVTVTPWEGQLVPTEGAPGGNVAALSQGPTTRAGIQITGGRDLPGDQQAELYRWRIRTGSCAAPGSVIGGIAQYPDLEHAPGTTTEAEAALTQGMPGGRNYHVVLIRAADDAAVACGQLQRV